MDSSGVSSSGCLPYSSLLASTMCGWCLGFGIDVALSGMFGGEVGRSDRISIQQGFEKDNFVGLTGTGEIETEANLV